MPRTCVRLFGSELSLKSVQRVRLSFLKRVRQFQKPCRLFKKLGLAIGNGSFGAVDHWDGYFAAINTALAYHHKVLVYVDTCELPPDHYFISLELPPKLDDDSPYIPVGEFEVQSFEKPVQAIQKTLRLGPLNQYMRCSS